ncbi:putative inosine uridine-preferring nucleoside hydrolase [Phaeomoniella chlamydospora]|uniref:Putative inosine uridine-preferring nucleoside hydrolase n=1 Tax=Phaeomoniella chlamydospora TaxID=158046 RepID=A0A0G2GLD3_PHACM|nr:putative inosine uridine-preferring nucleoside hydrolase [Phaeomoniella chlamydospora]
MRRTTFSTSIALVSFLATAATAVCSPKKIIIETDFYAFSDDPNAIGMANAFMSWGELEILGIISSINSEYASPAIDVIDTFYGNGDVPLAVRRPLNDSTGVWEYSDYPDYVIPLIEHFYEDVGSGYNTSYPVPLYRKLLAEAPDNSVTIAMIGFLDNIYDLLLSKPDNYSSLSGLDLVKAKVVELVMQASPTTPSYNLDHVNGTYAEYVLSVWPNTITFVPGSIGSATKCCVALTTELDISTNPIAFTWNITVGYNESYKSWDPTAMLYVARGLGNWYIWNETTEEGYAVEANATNGYTYIDTTKKSPAPQRAVEIAPTYSNTSLADLIQSILLWTPGEANPADSVSYCNSASTTTNTTANATASSASLSVTAYTGAAGRQIVPAWGVSASVGVLLACVLL